jgi:hypothetical protein
MDEVTTFSLIRNCYKKHDIINKQIINNTYLAYKHIFLLCLHLNSERIDLQKVSVNLALKFDSSKIVLPFKYDDVLLDLEAKMINIVTNNKFTRDIAMHRR